MTIGCDNIELSKGVRSSNESQQQRPCRSSAVAASSGGRADEVSGLESSSKPKRPCSGASTSRACCGLQGFDTRALPRPDGVSLNSIQISAPSRHGSSHNVACTQPSVAPASSSSTTSGLQPGSGSHSKVCRRLQLRGGGGGSGAGGGGGNGGGLGGGGRGAAQT